MRAGRQGRRGDQCIEVAPAVAGLDHVHAIPRERLLDQQFAAQHFVESARRLVAGDHPCDQSGGAVCALRGSDRTDQAAPDSGALRVADEIHRRKFGIEAVLALGQHVAGREADHAVGIRCDEYACRIGAGGEDFLPQRGAVLDFHRGQIPPGDHSLVGRAPRVHAHLGDRQRVGGRRGAYGDVHRTRRTAVTTLSTVNPKCLNSAPAGADSPKVSMPTTAALGSSTAPTYFLQPSVTPASTATLGTPRGNTAARYAAFCRSNKLVHGIDTTRTAMPSFARASRAPSPKLTSDPVAMMTARAPLPAGKSAST